jgi:hypothetical protein
VVHDKTISSSQQLLESFLDDHFVIDEIAFRSQFRIDRDHNHHARAGIAFLERWSRARKLVVPPWAISSTLLSAPTVQEQ